MEKGIRKRRQEGRQAQQTRLGRERALGKEEASQEDAVDSWGHSCQD